MSDQMPDEGMIEKRPDDVWTDGSARASGIYMTYRFGAYRHRYIRDDLYEQAGDFDHQGIDPADLGQHFADAMQALTARNAVSKAACAQLIAEQAQRAEQAEAELAENEGVINVWRGRADRAEAELAARRADDESAANMLLLDLPEPGTPMAQMFSVRAQLIRRAEQAEAERDRLRAALERAREMAEDGKTSACSMQVCEDIELIAQEALDHD